METDEDPFSRIRRRKKDSRGDAFSARRERSSNLSRLSFVVGNLCVMSFRRPMIATCDGGFGASGYCQRQFFAR
jgi:hypothetical protein